MRNEIENSQAEKLQQLFDEINNRPIEKKERKENKKEEEYIEVDVLNLPPRKEVHTNPRTRLHFPFKKPIIRISIVCIFVIAILITLFFILGEQLLVYFSQVNYEEYLIGYDNNSDLSLVYSIYGIPCFS